MNSIGFSPSTLIRHDGSSPTTIPFGIDQPSVQHKSGNERLARVHWESHRKKIRPTLISFLDKKRQKWKLYCPRGAIYNHNNGSKDVHYHFLGIMSSQWSKSWMMRLRLLWGRAYEDDPGLRRRCGGGFCFNWRMMDFNLEVSLVLRHALGLKSHILAIFSQSGPGLSVSPFAIISLSIFLQEKRSIRWAIKFS